MIERKCLKCQTWNNDEDYCKSCNAPLSPKALDKVRELRLAAEEAAREPDKIQIYQERAKNSKYFLVRVAYYIVYSIFVTIGAIGAFLAWLTAMANG